MTLQNDIEDIYTDIVESASEIPQQVKNNKKNILGIPFYTVLSPVYGSLPAKIQKAIEYKLKNTADVKSGFASAVSSGFELSWGFIGTTFLGVIIPLKYLSGSITVGEIAPYVSALAASATLALDGYKRAEIVKNGDFNEAYPNANELTACGIGGGIGIAFSKRML